MWYKCMEEDFETRSRGAAMHHTHLTGHTMVVRMPSGRITTKIELLKD